MQVQVQVQVMNTGIVEGALAVILGMHSRFCRVIHFTLDSQAAAESEYSISCVHLAVATTGVIAVCSGKKVCYKTSQIDKYGHNGETSN